MTAEGARQYLTGLIKAAAATFSDPNLVIEYPNLPADTKAVEYYLCVEIVPINGGQVSLGGTGERVIRQYSQVVLLAYTREGCGNISANAALQHIGYALEFKTTPGLLTHACQEVSAKSITGWYTKGAVIPFDFDRLA